MAIRCPSCNSKRIIGTREIFKCRACGFVHNSLQKNPFKPVSEVAKDGMIFRENLEALVVEKKGSQIICKHQQARERMKQEKVVRKDE